MFAGAPAAIFCQNFAELAWQRARRRRNAAINPPTRTILNDTLDDWRRTIQINLEAVYMGSKLVAPHMVKRQQGRIISIASIQGFASSGETGAYNAAKGAILAFTKSMAVELGRYSILVNAVAPGFMLTPMSIVNGVNETETPEFLDSKPRFPTFDSAGITVPQLCPR